MPCGRRKERPAPGALLAAASTTSPAAERPSRPVRAVAATHVGRRVLAPRVARAATSRLSEPALSCGRGLRTRAEDAVASDGEDPGCAASPQLWLKEPWAAGWRGCGGKPGERCEGASLAARDWEDEAVESECWGKS
jgi:hypothetical protein